MRPSWLRSMPTATSACSSRSTSPRCGPWPPPPASREARSHEPGAHLRVAAGDAGARSRVAGVLEAQQRHRRRRPRSAARRPGGVHRPRRRRRDLCRRHRGGAGVATVAPAHLLLPTVLRRGAPRQGPGPGVRQRFQADTAGIQRIAGPARGAGHADRGPEPDARQALRHRLRAGDRLRLHRLFAARLRAACFLVRRRHAAAASANPSKATQDHYGDTSMKVKSSLLSAAIVSALVVASPASAAKRGHADTARGDAVAARAQALLANRAVANQAQAASADEFVPGAVLVDADGTEHVRFQRLYQGLPMIGGDLVVHSRNGQVAGISQTLATSERPGLAAGISSGRAIVEASTDFATPFSAPPGARMVVYARGPQPVLAYEVTMSGIRADQTPTEMRYIVDAANGSILAKWDEVHTAKPGRDKGGCTN